MQDDIDTGNGHDDSGHQSERNVVRATCKDIDASTILIYQPEDLRCAIEELEGEERDWGDDFVVPDAEKPQPSPETRDLSSEDRIRLDALRRIARGPLGARRRLIFGSARMIHRLVTVKRQAPHFGAFVDLVCRAAILSMSTSTPLHLPPVLLLGEPGIGKTFVIKLIAEALAGGFDLLPMNMLDSFRIRGLNTAWKGAKVGRIAEALLKSPSASPIILLDEFEKATQTSIVDRPFDVFHSLLEEENAREFSDDFLGLAMRADHVIWIASANSTVGLPDSIVDRLVVMEISSPSPEHRQVVVDSIYQAVRHRYGNIFDETLRDDVQHELTRYNPRRVKRILNLAIAFAAQEDRTGIGLRDVMNALDVAEMSIITGGFRHGVGFC